MSVKITQLTEDLSYIQQLGDNPRTDNGLTARELKEWFDKAPNSIKTYVNEKLIPELENEINSLDSRTKANEDNISDFIIGSGFVPLDGSKAMTGDLNMGNHTITGLKTPTASGHAANMGYVNDQTKKASPFNHLINSNFRNPVNTNGQTSYTNNDASRMTFAVDRWKGVNGTYTVNNGYVSFASAKNATYKRFLQIINMTIKAGKPYTIAMRARVNEISTLRFRPCTSSYGTISGASHLDIKAKTSGFETFLVSFTPANDEVNPGFDLLCFNTANDYVNMDIEWAAWYEGAYTLDTLPEYQPKGYEAELLACRQYDPATGAYIGLRKFGYAHNLLVNSDFRNAVNTNGKTSYTGSGYSINEWRAYHATTTHAVTSDGIKVSATDANYAMYQVLDVSKLKTNTKYTAAAMDSTGKIYIWVGYITNTSAGSGVAVYVSGSNTLFRIYGAATWVWAGLYEGEYTIDTLPDYQPKDRVLEELDCGIVNASKFSLNASDYPMHEYRLTEDGVMTGSMFFDQSNRRHILRSYHSDTDGKATRFSESYYFPPADAGLTEHKSYSVLTNKEPVTISQGGTGATTAEQARTNLGIDLTKLSPSFTTGSGTRDTTNTQLASELKYFKFGRVVIARFDLAMATSANASYTTYQVATGFPKASGSARNACHLADANGNGWSCPCEVTNTGALRVHVRNPMGGMTVIGSVVYIAES